jgi:hypothetical protein
MHASDFVCEIVDLRAAFASEIEVLGDSKKSIFRGSLLARFQTALSSDSVRLWIMQNEKAGGQIGCARRLNDNVPAGVCGL